MREMGSQRVSTDSGSFGPQVSDAYCIMGSRLKEKVTLKEDKGGWGHSSVSPGLGMQA